MDIQNRLKLLQRIYDLHAANASETRTACHRGCAACCTCNVTATTIEGLMVFQYLLDQGRSSELEMMVQTPPALRFQPKVTLNQMVEMCAQGQEPPDEANDPSAGRCPLLRDDTCSIYPVRPLGCRAMLSAADCRQTGEAEMPPIMLSVNNVAMQYVEAMDQPGGTGNLIDVISFLNRDDLHKAYANGEKTGLPETIQANRSFPVLMVPPEHRHSLQSLIQALNGAIRQHQ